MTRWFHGGPAGLSPGTLLNSRSRSRTLESLTNFRHILADKTAADSLADALRRHHDPCKVYVSPLVDTARTYAALGGAVYQVQPFDAPELDLDFGQEYHCDQARILRTVESDVARQAAALFNRLEEAERKTGVTIDPLFKFQLAATAESRAAKLFRALLKHVTLNGIHGAEHSVRVLANGLSIAAATPGVDTLVVAAFAALHDARRDYDGHDPEHGARAAALARELHSAGALPLTTKQLETLVAALAWHDCGETTDNPTIGSCWDGDRLELPRVGIDVNPRLLSTTCARESHVPHDVHVGAAALPRQARATPRRINLTAAHKAAARERSGR